jgi:hypothetical protein
VLDEKARVHALVDTDIRYLQPGHL